MDPKIWSQYIHVHTGTISSILCKMWNITLFRRTKTKQKWRKYIVASILSPATIHVFCLHSWYGDTVSTRCHSACCWSNVMPSTAVCIVIRSCGASNTSLITWRPSLCSLQFTVQYGSLSLTARHLSPSRSISILIHLVYHLVYLFRARIDCVKRPCSSLGYLWHYNFVKVHYN